MKIQCVLSESSSNCSNKGMPFSSLPHENLVMLGQHPGLLSVALKKWFSASEGRKLARWLIFDALFEETSSTSKFLAVAQAWEVLGWEYLDGTNQSNEYQTARAVAIKALENLGTQAAQRYIQLLQSSNKRTFGDLVRKIIKETPDLAVKVICQDLEKFVSYTVKVRNSLTHMEEKKTLSIMRASYISMFLTYKLIVLFCIHACAALELPMDKLAQMLSDNDTSIPALRPIPEL